MSERGDRGLTSGECNLTVSKDSPFVEAVGAIDDFQARLGSARVLLEEKENNDFLMIENDLMEVMSSFYKKTKWERGEDRIGDIEKSIEVYRGRVENLNNFLVPGKNEIESRINLCRTSCRTAERRVVTLGVDEKVLKYFNKLSAYLYWVWRNKLD